MSMMSVIRGIFTGKDGNTYDLGRILWAAMGFGYVIFAAISVWRDGSFNPQDFGIGAGTILGGGGIGIGAKANTEPEK